MTKANSRFKVGNRTNAVPGLHISGNGVYRALAQHGDYEVACLTMIRSLWRDCRVLVCYVHTRFKIVY
jgi:hypothetical protein